MLPGPGSSPWEQTRPQSGPSTGAPRGLAAVALQGSGLFATPPLKE